MSETSNTAPLAPDGAAVGRVLVVDPPRPSEFELVEQIEHDDGIYFDLDEDTYHADTALGSSDMGKLFWSPATYWHESRFNALREEEDRSTPSRVNGTAVHCFVLYGEAEFEARYAPLFEPGTTKAGKAERESVAAWGKIGLKWDDYKRIKQTGTLLRADPYNAMAFEGGRAEVSVFWTDLGVRKKARFDYLKVRATVDLKSIAPTKKIPFEQACAEAVAHWNYPLQAAHYEVARENLARLVHAGQVHGDYDEAWLRQVAQSREWAWVWVFIQSRGPALTGSFSLTPGNVILETAHRMLETAEANFRTYRDELGMTTPWVKPQPTRELDITDMPAWWAR